MIQKNLDAQVKDRTEIISKQFSEKLLNVQNVHYHLSSDQTLTTSRYYPTKENVLLAYDELCKMSYADFIDSIVYIDVENKIYLYTKQPLIWDNPYCSFYNASKNKWEYRFKPEDYTGGDSSHLVTLNGEDASYLLFFSPTYNDSYHLFYVINKLNILSMFKENAINERTAIALVDSNGDVVISTANSQFNKYNFEFSDFESNKMYTIDDDVSIYMGYELESGVRIAYLYSYAPIVSQIRMALRNVLVPLFAVALFAFIIIVLGMRFTWYPLQKIIKKWSGDGEVTGLKQFDITLDNMQQKQADMTNKISKYQYYIKKTVLEQVKEISTATDSEIANFNIDLFFDANPDHNFFVCMVSAENSLLPVAEILEYIEYNLNTKNIAVLISQTKETAFFLIDYTGNDMYKDKVLLGLMERVQVEFNVLCAVSNNASSYLEIPALFKNAIYAAGFWKEKSVCLYTECPPNDNAEISSAEISYPFQLLKDFTESLTNSAFSEIYGNIEKIFKYLLSNNYPNYFTQCVVMDMLTGIHIFLSNNKIIFSSYNQVFYKIKYLCQQYSFYEKFEELMQEFDMIIGIAEEQISYREITIEQLKQIMQENYCSPDFSITVLANKFSVSIAYMSYQFTKKMNNSFVEYLWNMRYEKAIDLLLHSDMKINDISRAIGYENSSSFRRRFKQKTGEAPDSYRNKHKCDD